MNRSSRTAGTHRTLTRRLAGGRRSEGALPSPNSLSMASTPLPQKVQESVTHVSGTKWNLCLGPLSQEKASYKSPG